MITLIVFVVVDLAGFVSAWFIAHGLGVRKGYRLGRTDAAQSIEEFAAKRKASAEQHPPETAFAHHSNRNVLATYKTAAEVARGGTR